ncbi:MCE family protein [Nocardioides sp. W3-2-3]|uniref:MlaD family protein n=1 Tax=Nocardioides convexus TaxID=2712224 RepID=UPI0024181779|nr:MCE family protein [Nocardioides convexus]NHA00704.1 MCE family protein [Nocardioides convexus]
MNRILAAHKALGVIFVCLLLLGVWLTYATFSKKFVSYDKVTLTTSTVGLQSPTRADVKIRGVIVGEVLEARSGEGKSAVLTLGIYPDKISEIPANVTGSIVPKTLFGEKYVSLVVPDTGPSGTIRVGATIDRTKVATELEEVLSDIYPLLTTVRPADLNATLTALATALDGRGEQLGKNLETVDSYLKRINPEIPALLQDLKADRAGVRHLCRHPPPGGPDPRQHGEDDRHAGGEGGVADRDPARRAQTSPTPHAPSSPPTSPSLREAGEPEHADPARRRPVRRHDPLHGRGHRQGPGPPGQCLPRLRACTSCWRPCRSSRASTPRRTPRSSATTAARTASACRTSPTARRTPTRRCRTSTTA